MKITCDCCRAEREATNVKKCTHCGWYVCSKCASQQCPHCKKWTLK